MKEPLKKGELDVRINYIKLGQAIKTAIYTLQKVEIILEQAGLEAGLKELERMERDEKSIVD
jgi:formylmethanofuran dehydrogenase subunit A